MDNAEDLDDAASNGLFSMSATDNAEVVPSGVHRGAEGLWSVSAKHRSDEEREPSDDPVEAEAAEGSDSSPAGVGEPISEPADSAAIDQGYRGDGYPADDAVAAQGEPPFSASAPGGFEKPYPDDDQDVEEVEGEIIDMPGDGTDTDADGTDNFSDMEDDDDWVDFDQDDDVGQSDGAATDSVGSIFTAEPVDRGDDVVDEPDVIDDDGFPGHSGISSSLFSSGGTLGGAASSAFAGTGAPYFTPAGGPGASGGLWEPTDGPSSPRGRGGDPLRSEPLWEASEGAYGAQGVSDSYLSHRDQAQLLGDEESPGYEAAILKLHPQDRERASVALSVAGALLHEGEEVLGVVTGQMLGRPSAVVVTAGRVLVVNDRRWQPVVDTYKIDTELRVRGRHDRNVAALSFSNDWSLSMVDGITEVSLAMDLAEQIRVIADS
ncbi:MAG: hypothetical protein WBF71_09345 [Microthrixaceae bacterium]